jgi:hypothetical protein
VIVNASQLCLPTSAGGSNGLRVLDIHPVLQAVPGKGPVHRACVNVHEAQGLGYQFGVGALAAGAGAINGNDDGLFLGHRFRLGHPLDENDLTGKQSVGKQFLNFQRLARSGIQNDCS